MNRSLTPALVLVGVTAVWGATYVVVQDVTTEMPVFAFLFWRFFLAGLALFLIRPNSLRILTPTDWRRALALGLLLSVGFGAQTIGLQYTSATIAGFITGMFVVFTPLLAALVWRQQISGQTWGAVALATVGLALISLNGFGIGFGEAIVLVCAVAFAAHLVCLSEWSSGEKAYALTIVQLMIVALVSLFLSAFSGGPRPPGSANAWLAIIFLALIATALAYLIQTWAQAHITSTRAAVILTLEPVFAGIFGVLVAGDVLTWRMAIGGVMILAAMYLAGLAPKRKLVESSPHP